MKSEGKKRWLLLGLALLLVLAAAGWPKGALAESQAPAIEEQELRSTLENQTLLAGSAAAGTRIFCSVYTRSEEGEVTLLYQTEQQVGESGLYQMTVPLPVLGRQYVLLRAGEDETLYVYNRCRRQLASDLRGYYLNIYQVLKEGTP